MSPSSLPRPQNDPAGPNNNSPGRGDPKRPTRLLPHPSTHRRLLGALSLGASALTLLVTLLAARLPLFDASPRAVLLPPPFSSSSASSSSATDAAAVPGWRDALAGALLRWDAFHYAHVALTPGAHAHAYEHEWAFLPGAPLVLRLSARLLSLLGSSQPQPQLQLQEGGARGLGWADALAGGCAAAVAASPLATLALYDLTLAHTRAPDAALLAAALSLLPSSPVTLRLAAYSEPFFTLASYRGMLHCAREQWVRAACCFALASFFRSNGVLLSGFLVWGLVVEPVLTRRKLPFGGLVYASTLTLLTCAPFLYHQYSGYRLFCVGTPSPAPWCHNFPPSIYTYVQSRYWNGGFLRYWTPQQIPNFLLAAPPLVLLFWFSTRYILVALLPRLLTALSSPAPPPTKPPPNPFLGPSLAPHAVHALALALVLLFAAHTQIVLRLAAALPFTYWAAAALLVERPAAGALWVAWSVVWGALSCVLWAAFLPPA